MRNNPDMDTVSSSTRSRMMSGIHGSDTRPELFIRKGLFAHGFRFRTNCRDLPGRPDLKLTRYGAVILVHGCFWHGHSCRYFRLPSSNVPFWSAKIEKNRARDLRDVRSLREAGWRVCIVWECAVRLAMGEKDGGRLMDGIESWLRSNKPFIEFFDTASMSVNRSAESHPRKALIGRNASVSSFAAEREPPYGAVTQDR